MLDVVFMPNRFGVSLASLVLLVAGCGGSKKSGSGSESSSGPTSSVASGVGGASTGAATSTEAGSNLSTTSTAGSASGGASTGSGGTTTAGSTVGANTGGTGSAGASTTGGAGAGGATEDCVSQLHTEPDSLDVEINASGFDEYENLLVRFVSLTDSEWGAVAETHVAGGAFRFQVPTAAWHYTHFAIYVDRDGSDSCNADEPAWGFTTGPGGCSLQPCPNSDGVVVENIRLPLDECEDCGQWIPHENCSIGQPDHDLAEELSCQR